ncbi:PHD finger protein 14 isoform X7 [Carcharodon carcharias]|uniref:PHD finger protein 14 isoform X7 n=1 Tax=Carcharodon carcharias TaxID=13397 RepID=UPI001B7E2C94|nr:PHD finger protein 14 isoform X7 [Carcharodon carcharias]
MSGKEESDTAMKSMFERGPKKRQVKTLATSLLEALDYDSSDDSDFEVGDASDSDGSGESAGKDSEEGSESEGGQNGSEEDSEQDKKDTSDGKIEAECKDDQSEEPDLDTKEQAESKTSKKKTKEIVDDAGPDESNDGQKKWNLRKKRTMLDMISVEELNGFDDYDSEDDNDWRPCSGKKKGKGVNNDDGDEGGGEDDDISDSEDGNPDDEEDSSSASEEDRIRRKNRPSSQKAAKTEGTSDGFILTQNKNYEDSFLAEREQNFSSQKMDLVQICCVCLGDNSEDADEIVQCDNCGVTVHEGCYGVDGESDSIMSSASENSTEPWFCDACKCGASPSCELCPNVDGIFKETDAGRWVHVVCALYVPGVAFGDIDKLRPVTLTEMNYSKYGAKECSLCEDIRFARTGVCISCDAGMCRAYFHVTCAQREGLLSEAAAEEARITTRLQQYRAKVELARSTKPNAWVPREKLPRPLTSSASVIRKLMRKAELMGISTDIFPVDTLDTNSSVDGRRKHKQPALTADFVNYYLERNMRMMQIQENICEQKNLKDKLQNEQESLHVEYNKLFESLENLRNMNGKLRREGQTLWSTLSNIVGQKLNFPVILRTPKERRPSKKDGGTLKSLAPPAVLYSCGICKKNHDQHLLVLCDTCKLYYHLGCLDPPLTRMPKKTKNSYWQCSECDQAGSSDLEADITMETLPDGTKRSRRQIKEPVKFTPLDIVIEPKKIMNKNMVLPDARTTCSSMRSRGQKRKRGTSSDGEKAEEPIPPRARRRRQTSLQKRPKSEDLRTECATCKSPGDNENLVRAKNRRGFWWVFRKISVQDQGNLLHKNEYRCDECRLCYHFGCLDPPLKKSPKQTGYGWICQECDSTSSKALLKLMELDGHFDKLFFPDCSSIQSLEDEEELEEDEEGDEENVLEENDFTPINE